MTEENKGVSIVVSTNKEGFLENIFSNFEHQKWETKELIIILNNDSLIMEDWINRAKQTDQVTVYQLPQRVSLGNCLNFGFNQAKYDYIAKFDDDDYYGPFYLREAIRAFEKTNADVVGKRTTFMYMVKSKQLRLRRPGKEGRWVKSVQGGTIIIKKEVLSKIRFADVSINEDVNFLSRCINHGFKIFSTPRYNYTYIRRDDGTHTWHAKLHFLYRTSIKSRVTDDFKKYVNKYSDTD